MAEPHPTDPLAQLLLQLYSDAYQRTMERLAIAIKGGRSSNFSRAWLMELQRTLITLRQQTQTWALGADGRPGALATSWQQGADASVAAFARQGVQVTAEFSVLNQAAVRITAQNLMESLSGALTVTGQQVQTWGNVALALARSGGPYEPLDPFIGRAIRDEYRRAGLDAIARKLTDGLTVRQTKAVLVNDLQSHGLTAMVDQAGRRWQLPDYAGMVARTTSREAYTQGNLQVITGLNHDLVQATTHWPTCPMCAARQGRVYSISGKTPGYPALAVVGPTPWHSNCGHGLVPFVAAFVSPEQLLEIMAASNRPFDQDPRSAAETAAYKRSQEINRLRRERQGLMAQLSTREVPLDAHMRRWVEELQAPGLDAAGRRELEGKMGARADAWAIGRKERLKEINGRLKGLAREQREAFKARR